MPTSGPSTVSSLPFDGPDRPASTPQPPDPSGGIINGPPLAFPNGSPGQHGVPGSQGSPTHSPSHSWSPSQPDSHLLALIPEARRDLQWWIRTLHLTSGVSFYVPDPELSDRCFLLWVGRSLEQPDGFWDLARPVVEPAHKLAGTKSYVADLAALPQVRHTTVEVLSNNSTTVSYINKQGGTLFDPVSPGLGIPGLV